MMVEKICEGCNKKFLVKFKERGRKYCNKQCYFDSGFGGSVKNPDIREKRICVNCNNEFEVKKKQPNKLCSNECRVIWSSKPENLEKRLESSRKVIFEKYGVDYLFETIEWRKKAKDSFKLKYGVNHAMEVKRFVDKLKNTIKVNTQPLITERLKQNNIILLDEYITNKNKNKSIHHNFQCLICDNKFTSTLLGSSKTPICRKCYPIIKNSKTEQIIKDYVNELNITHIDNIRLLDGKEIDMFFNDLSLGLEINGNYFHSEIFGEKNKHYHLTKTVLANDKGIKLLHIHEDEVLLKLHIVKSRLKHILSFTENKVYARKTVIKEVPKKISTDFLINNHIQGNCVDKIRYGLYHNNELVSLMTFSNVRKSLGNKNTQGKFELLRFCNKLDYTVVGGFSKLLKHFINNNQFESILTFADIRWSGINPEDTVYLKNGFNYLGNTPPNYWYVKTNDFLNRQHRFQFRKDVLVKQGFDVNKTEWEIMQENGYDRIWDCGNMKFEYKNITFGITPTGASFENI